MGNTGYDFPQANFHVSLESHMSIPGVNIPQLPGRQVDLILYSGTYYFQHNYYFFTLKMCIGSHAPRRTRQKVAFEGESRAVGLSMETASCHPSGAKNLKLAPRFLGNLCTPGLYLIRYHI
jgi:hypothetical protein